MMNVNMQVGAMLDQRQQPQQQFQLQHSHQSAALMNPMSVAMAMGQSVQSSAVTPNGFHLLQRQPTPSQQPVPLADVKTNGQVKLEGIDPVNVDSKSSAEVRHAMKLRMHFGANKNPSDEPVTPTAVETALMALVDATTLALVSPAKIKRFIIVLHGAKTEPEQALVLVILRATATSSNTKLAQSCASAFEQSGGLKVAKQWLEAAVTWNYSDLLVLLLEVLKRIPLQLTSITEARINEPIVKLRKGAREERVKRAAQELLKYWRTKFTEKEKPAAPAASAATATTSQASPAVSAPPSSSSNGSTSNGAAVKASSPRSSPASATASTVGTSTAPSKAAPSSPPKVSKLVGKVVKRRPIKRLERLPFGGGNAVSKSSSSELIGNLMQRKAKEAAAAASASKADGSPPRDSDSSDANDSNAAAADATVPTDEKKESSASGELPMELPTIQSFKAAVAAPVSSKSSKRIRWADDNGEELVKVKLIESWRDMVQYTPHDENSFRDAKLREHADERNAMKSHKDPVRASFKLTLAHNWRAPAFVLLPEALADRRRPLQTDEVHGQASRTRREMEYLVLDGEVPPPTPKEWVRPPNDLVRGAPFEISLADVADAPPTAAVPVGGGGVLLPPARPAPGVYEEYESEEDRALREALGPLSKSTIAVLLENEDVLPQVFDEAQRNGNHIPDARVLEIVDYHRRARGLPPPMPMATPHAVAGPGYSHPANKYGGGHRGEPPSMYNRYGGYDAPPPAPAPPMNAGMPYGNGGNSGFGKKRKAPTGREAGGFGDAPPPPKRMSKRPCLFFNTARGCKNGASCAFLHEAKPGNTNGGGNMGRYGQPMHDMGGRGSGGGNGGGPRHHFRGGRWCADSR